MESRLPITSVSVAVRSLNNEIYKEINGFTEQQQEMLSEKVELIFRSIDLLDIHRQDIEKQLWKLANAVSNTSPIINQ